MFNKKSLKTLEYTKIINMLSNEAQSECGKKLCKNLLPSTDINEIEKWQENTFDALKLIWSKGSVSFLGISDITPSIKRLEIGSFLGIGELLSIRDLLQVALRVKTFSRKENDQLNEDSLSEYFNLIEPISNVNNEISRCILGPEEIADNASSTLLHIRQSMKKANAAIHTQLTKIMNGSQSKTYLQDNLITMRDGRYCIPVKQEYKNQISGMIHDQSATGSTFFIEPMAVVNLNNELKELFIKENDEIQVILANLSNLCSGYSLELTTNLDILSKLDFIFAKANLAKSLNCSKPIFSKDKYINIKEGRHPLIDKKVVVPINIYLGKDFDLLIITGPNTGGKTVSLKTVGLLTLMGQAGLHIPAFEGSTLGVFDQIFADIGDEQSIEQNLSTFSSHMVNDINIINTATPDSLVLFDELGSGTDPVEGAALAMSILTFLHNMQIRTIATTHYSELKMYALSTEKVSNACCEFDVASLRPTYKLLIGVPGKSNAFAISSKLGLPSYIIEDAKKRIHEDNIAFEDIVTELENNRSSVLKEKEEISLLRSELAVIKKRYNEKYDNLDLKREEIITKARQEAADILSDAKEFADQTIKNMNKLSKQGNMKELEAFRSKAGKKLTDTNKNLGLKKKNITKKNYSAKDFKVGDRVKVLTMGLEGNVSTTANAKGDLYVQMGILRSLINYKNLEKIDQVEITGPNIKKMSSGHTSISKSSYISQEINLIGKNSDDAVAALEKYLDDAYMSSLSQVRIVHGKGTGALRTAVTNYLKRQSFVKSFRLGVYGEGDAGVTIVEFK